MKKALINNNIFLNQKNKMQKLTTFLFAFFVYSFVYSKNVSDTLKAVYVDVITTNKTLIDFNEKLNNFPSKAENIHKYFKLYNSLSEKDKDTTLLVLLYKINSYEYLEENYDYSSLENREQIAQINKSKLKPNGYKLITISHGDIVTVSMPKFIEKHLKNSLNTELFDFLKCYLQQRQTGIIFWNNDYYEKYIIEMGNYLLLLENYIEKNNFLTNYFRNKVFYDVLIQFSIGVFHDDYYGKYEEIHILDKRLSNIYKNFIRKNPKTKTAKFLKILFDLKNKSEKNDFFEKLISKMYFNPQTMQINEKCSTYDNFLKIKN